MLTLLAAPLAGAASLLVCALALGIDPLVSAIIGALVWAGVQLVWSPPPGDAGTEQRRKPTPGQARQLEAARARIVRIRGLAAELEAKGVIGQLDSIARRAEIMVARLQSDPGQFELYRKALGNYLAQGLELVERLRGAERAGRADAGMVARLTASFDRLDTLFAAVENRGAAMDRIDLDARIAVLEAEIDADLALRND